MKIACLVTTWKISETFIIEMHREFEISEIPPYENIMEGNVNEQANICKIFSKNLKILQNLKKKVK